VTSEGSPPIGSDDEQSGPPAATPRSSARGGPTIGLVIPVVFLVAFGLIALAAVVGRSGDRECTLVGCASLVRFDLETQPEAIRAAATTSTICVDGTCTTEPIAAGQPFALGDLPGLAAGSVSIVLTDAGGAEVARYQSTEPFIATATYPNGPDCDPPCPSLRLAALDGVLVQRS
jgi:hypothetical protein